MTTPVEPAIYRNGLLTNAEVIGLVAELGRPIKIRTWSAYVARGQAHAPTAYVSRTPLWSVREVREWAASGR